MDYILIIIALSLPNVAWAKSSTSKNVQHVEFSGSEVDGQVRNPDGSFLNQRKGMNFLPLYKVKQHIDQGIKDSLEYIR